MLIKKRRAKKSDRGVYLQDVQLRETIFQPGSHYKYIVDVKDRKVIILSSSDLNDNLVSKRALKQGVKPVIDIRNKNALVAFDGCSYLQVEIFDDQIVIEGYVDDELCSQPSSKEKRTLKKGQVVDITQLLHVKRKAIVVCSKEDLRQAVGFESYDFDSSEDLRFNIPHTSWHDAKWAIKEALLSLQVSSFFSGAGLFDQGFLNAGFDIVYALEKDPGAAATYRANFGSHIINSDICDVDLSTVPKTSIAIAGVPCQGHSNTNRNNRSPENSNNLLIYKFIEAVKTVDCQVFVIENVPQFLTNWNGMYKKIIDSHLSDFEITSGVLSAADFGAPQIRKRSFVIGSKVGRIELPRPTAKVHKTVAEAFNGLHDGIPNQMDFSNHDALTLQRIKSVPPRGNIHDIPEEIRPKGKHSNMYRRLDWNEPSPTIVNARKSMLLHPEEDRILSVRECARLQGLKDSFRFRSTLSAMQQQICNGVPVQLAQAVANAVKKAITAFNLKTRRLSFT